MRKIPRDFVQDIRQAHERRGFSYARVPFSFMAHRRERTDDDVVVDGHVAQHAVVLERADQTLPGNPGGALASNVLTHEGQLAARGLVVAAYHVESGAFAGAIGADESKDFSFADFEAQFLDRHQAAKAAAQAIDFK